MYYMSRTHTTHAWKGFRGASGGQTSGTRHDIYYEALRVIERKTQLHHETLFNCIFIIRNLLLTNSEPLVASMGNCESARAVHLQGEDESSTTLTATRDSIDVFRFDGAVSATALPKHRKARVSSQWLEVKPQHVPKPKVINQA